MTLTVVISGAIWQSQWLREPDRNGSAPPGDAGNSYDGVVTGDISVGTMGNVYSVAVGNGDVWISTSARSESTLVRVDADTNEIIARVPAVSTGWVSGGGGLAVAEDGVWVTGSEGANAIVQRVDPATNTVVATIDLGPGEGSDIALDEDHIWVLTKLWPDSATLFRIDRRSEDVVATINIEAGWARRIFLTTSHVWVLAAQVDDNGSGGPTTLTSIDRETNGVTRSVSSMNPPVAADGSHLWAVGSNEGMPVVIRIDAATGEPDGMFEVPADELRQVTASDDRGLWLIGETKAKAGTDLYLLDTATGAVDLVGDGSDSPIDIAAASSHIWLLDDDGTLTRVDLFLGSGPSA